MTRLAIASLLALAGIILSTGDAHAYLDPGTGSIVLQAIIGTVAAASAVVGLYWARLKAFFASLSTRKKPGGGTPDARDRSA